MRWSIEDFVYGGTDGAVTTFAIVSGAFGASLSIPIILILGFANLFADGFSMSIGNYLSGKTHKEYIEKEQISISGRFFFASGKRRLEGPEILSRKKSDAPHGEPAASRFGPVFRKQAQNDSLAKWLI